MPNRKKDQRQQSEKARHDTTLAETTQQVNTMIDADAFQDISAAQRDQLLADFAAGALTRERAVTGRTHAGGSRTWARWEEYCLSIGCQYIFIDSLSKQEQIILLGAFAMAVRSQPAFESK